MLNKPEQQFIQQVDTHAQNTRQLVKQSVDINSSTFNITGVKKAANLYRKVSFGHIIK